MSKKTIHGVLLDTESRTIRETVIEDSLDSFYEHLHCNAIDIVTRKIGGEYVDIVCDDEALIKENPVLAAVDEEFSPALFNSLFICGLADEEGELTSLTPEAARAVMDSICYTMRKDGLHPCVVVAE